jgi:membrane-bound serine protease (ClpP class)
MSAYIEDVIENAENSGSAVVLNMDTYGGQILQADNIKKTLLGATVPVDCYIRGNALSAGVLIAISCEHIIMADSAVIGAAETIPNDEKTLSTWVGILKSAAEARGRDANLIAAMADKRIAIEGVTEADELLTLAGQEASDLGVSDGTASNINEALAQLGYADAALSEQPMSFPTRAAQFLTSTTIASLLFIAAIVCMGIEIFTPGFGIFGALSILFFGLYFGGSFLAGYAEWWTAALFVFGIAMVGVEIAVPGFGVFGILGILGIGAGLLFAARDLGSFLIIFASGVVGSAVLLPILYQIFKRLGLIRKVVLFANMETAEGYTSHDKSESLVGKQGIAETDLRPAGYARVDGVRLEVVSNGAYIVKGSAVAVVGHTPGRIVVDEIKEEDM